MKHLTDDDVRHIATLARLEIQDEDLGTYGKELSAILTYIETLSEVDTSNIEPLISVTNTQNQLRDDVVWAEADIINPDELLATSPLPIIDNQIQTPSAHG